MFGNLFSKPLLLTIDKKKVKFFSISDFEFSVSGRCSVPANKIMAMVELTKQQLERESHTIRKIERSLIKIITHSIEESGSISRLLNELSPSVFSQDHSWRDIVMALRPLGKEYDPLRRITLVKYMQYLSSRQDIIKYLHSQKGKESPARDSSDTVFDQDTSLFKETIPFNNSAWLTTSGHNRMERMPKGESILLTLCPEEKIDIILSKHKCNIENNEQVLFADPMGRQHILDSGRNEIGRSSSCNVLIDPDLNDISRLHVVIDILGKEELRLTDFSSHGTYIPSIWLEKH